MRACRARRTARSCCTRRPKRPRADRSRWCSNGDMIEIDVAKRTHPPARVATRSSRRRKAQWKPLPPHSRSRLGQALLRHGAAGRSRRRPRLPRRQVGRARREGEPLMKRILAALFAAAALAGGGIRAGLAHEADPLHRAVSAGRHVGHPRAHDRREARDRARPDHRRREQAGRQRQCRRRLRGQVAARRLHVPARGHRRDRDQPERVSDAAVRSRQGFRAGDDGRVLAAHPRRASGRAGASGGGARRAREVEARQAQLRGVVDRQRAASRGRRVRAARRRSTGPTSRTRAARRRSPTSSAGRRTCCSTACSPRIRT